MSKEYPKLFHDVAIYENKKILSKDSIFVVGSKTLDRVIKIEQKNIKLVGELLILLDGTNSIEKICEILDRKNYKIDIASLVELFARNGLIDGINGISNSEVDLTSRRLVDIPFFQVPKRFENVCKWIVRSIPILMVCLLIFVLINILYFNKMIIIEDVILYSFLASILAMMVHEIGHILYALAHGIKVSRIRISLLWGIMPMAYIKYNNLYFIDPKVRLGLIMSGIVSNLFFALLSSFIYYFTQSSFAMSFLYVNFGFMLINLLPHQATDGYFALSTLFNKNNIRLEVIHSLFQNRQSSLRLKLLVCIYISLIVMSALALGDFIYDIIMKIYDGKLKQYSTIIIILILFIIILQFILIYIRMRKTFKSALNEKER